MLNGKKIILGVTGGIAAYKAAGLCSLLMKQHAEVDVIMTKNALEFLTPLSFEALSHREVYTDTFEQKHPWEIKHISLATNADALIIAPATANIIAKLAHGIADDMLTTTALACTCRKMIAPAMNSHMYENPVTQKNLTLLREYGWIVIDPAEGHLACGEDGVGKLPEPQDLLQYVLHACACERDMEGMKVLVTAGPTQEALDPVRFLTNHSSGKMGYAIAEAAAMRGADVTLVSGPTSLPRPIFVEYVGVTTAEEMFEAVTSRSMAQDLIIKAAAVADYRPSYVSVNKIKKTDDGFELILPLEHTEDILQYLGENKPEWQILCGFSMETENLLENSRQKLEKKHLDMIAANSLSTDGAGFQGDTNILTLITKGSTVDLPLMSKRQAAHRLLDELMKITF